jgi:hypothetical protein
VLFRSKVSGGEYMMRDKVKAYIAKHCQSQINDYTKKRDCEHTFVLYGHGYKCFRCSKYTGLNSELNDLIKKYYTVFHIDLTDVPRSEFHKDLKDWTGEYDVYMCKDLTAIPMLKRRRRKL